MIASKELSQHQQSSGSGFCWMVLLSTAAFAAAFWASWQRPVWHDELYTLALARMPVAELMEALRMDSGPPLHYLICHLFYLLVGWQEGSDLGTFMVRLPSVLAFATLPWVVWRACPAANAAGLLGPLLTVIWLPMFYFATEARAYAVLALVNSVVWLWGPGLVRCGGWRIALFAVLAATLPMLHYIGILSLCALPLLAFVIPRSRWRSFAAALGAASLPLLTWTPMLLNAPKQSMGWVDTLTGPGRPGLATLQALSPAGPFPALFEPPEAVVPWWLSVLSLLLICAGCLLGATTLWRRHRVSVAEPLSTLFPALGLLPVPGLVLLAVCGMPVYFAGRTESFVWPIAGALAAILASRLSPLSRLIMGGPFITIGIGTIGMWMGELPSRPAAVGVEIGRALAPQLLPKDRIVVLGLWQLEVEHGIAEARTESRDCEPVSIEVTTIPSSQANHPGWFDTTAAMSPAVCEEAKILAREVQLTGERVWFVWMPLLPAEQCVFPAFQGLRRVPVMASTLVAVELLSQVPTIDRRD